MNNSALRAAFVEGAYAEWKRPAIENEPGDDLRRWWGSEALRRYPDETPAPAGPIGVAPCTCIRNVHCSVHGEEKPAPAGPKCADCGAPLNEGEAKTFTVCDACWEKTYGHRRGLPEAARRWRCTDCGLIVQFSELQDMGLGEGLHHNVKVGDADEYWCGPVVEDPSAGGGK